MFAFYKVGSVTSSFFQKVKFIFHQSTKHTNYESMHTHICAPSFGNSIYHPNDMMFPTTDLFRAFVEKIAINFNLLSIWFYNIIIETQICVLVENIALKVKHWFFILLNWITMITRHIHLIIKLLRLPFHNLINNYITLWHYHVQQPKIYKFGVFCN